MSIIYGKDAHTMPVYMLVKTTFSDSVQQLINPRSQLAHKKKRKNIRVTEKK